MEFVFAYIAGVLTLINPCVLPILPIVLASSTQASKHGPTAMAAGMSLTFVVLGMLILVFGRSVGLNEQSMLTFGAWAMIVFGTILLVPRLSETFATATAGFSGSANAGMDQLDGSGLSRQFLGGALLGAVWSPCIGPTLGGAISFASQGQSLVWSTLIMVFFALGVSTVILLLGYGTREIISSRRDLMRNLADKSRPLMGIVFLLVGVMLLTKTHHRIEAYLVDVLPHWLIDLSVKF